MTWFRGDDSFPTHPKVLRIPRCDRAAAVGLWTLAGMWCASQLTDGQLDAHMVEELAGSERSADLLVSVGLWEKTDAGYRFHHWEDYNPTKAQVEAERSAARERMRRNRSQRVRPNSERTSDVTPGEVPEQSQPNFAGNSGEVRITPSRPDPSLTDTYERGDVTFANAGARDVANGGRTTVPGTRPAPPEEPPEEPQPAAPPAPAEEPQTRSGENGWAVHESAMPPGRCPNHLALASAPPCGRCKDAREAREAWVAGRDAKVAAARAAAQAELKRETSAVRAAIDACCRCSERGVHLRTGILCSHDAAADEAPATGRAEARAASAALARRREARAQQAGGGPRRLASSQQLAKIAVIYDRAAMDRAARLADLSRRLGRDIGSMTALTRVEASAVIDWWESPAPEEPEAEAVIPMSSRREVEVAEFVMTDEGAAALDAAAVEVLDEDEHRGEGLVPEVGDGSTGDPGDQEPAEDYDTDDGEDDGSTGEYLADQQTWADAQPDPYVYAGGPNEPPF